MNTQSTDNLYSLEAEEALIGSVLIDPGIYNSLEVTSDHFYLHKLRQIWLAIERICTANRELDNLVLAEMLERMGKLEEIGGHAYLAQLVNATPSSLRAEEYARIVRDYSKRRIWRDTAGKIVRLAHDTNAKLEIEAGSIVNDLINSVRSTGAAEHVSKYTQAVLSETLERMDNPKEVWGISTGFKDFDYITGGLQQSEICYLSGEPGVGKSIFAMQAAYQMALNGHPGAVYSLEMPGTQVIRRLLSYLVKLPTRSLKSGNIDPEKISDISSEIEGIENLPLYMSDWQWSTIGIRADLARLKAKHDIQWFILDYAYLLQDGLGMSENDRTGYISAQLKSICRSLDLAGIVIHSLRKSGSGNMPTGRDLRGSNQQFYDTDILLLMVEAHEEPNTILVIFGKGRELENPKESFKLVKIQGYPALGNYQHTEPYKDYVK